MELGIKGFVIQYQVYLIGAVLLIISHVLRLSTLVLMYRHTDNITTERNVHIYKLKIVRIVINMIFIVGLVFACLAAYIFRFPALDIYFPSGLSAIIVNSIVSSAWLASKLAKVYLCLFRLKHFWIYLWGVSFTAFCAVSAITLVIIYKS
jgi:hypothetical protein